MTAALQLSPWEAHELWAPVYDQTPNPLIALEERVVEPLLPEMTGACALDLACGTGRWMERLVRCGARTVVGLDLSAGMLRQARRKDGLGGLLLEADVMSIPLQTSSIDFALCAFGLSYASDLQRTANELSRITRAKGHLIISDFHPSAQTRGWKRAFRHEGCVVEIASVNRPLDEISKSFEREGFSPVLLLEPEFGEAEKPIFEKSGKSVLLPRVLGQVALFVFVFRKVSG